METKDVDLEKLSKEWLEIKRVSIKYSSYVKYKNIVYLHIIPFFTDKKEDDLDELNIANYILSLTDEKHLSSSTVYSIKYVLNAIYKYGERKYDLHHIDFSYAKVPFLKENSKTLSVIEEQQSSQYCIYKVDSSSLATLLGLYAGLRVGEVCALKWNDIDLNEGVITVSKTAQRLAVENDKKRKTKLMILDPKTNSSIREVVLPNFFTEYLCEYSELFNNGKNGEYFILSNSNQIPDPRTIQRRFIRICKNFGFQTNFHTLRHTYATNCIKFGIDVKTVSEMLGHSNISITLNRYVHPSLEFKKIQINKFEKPLAVVD